jgi:hypothetical protein
MARETSMSTLAGLLHLLNLLQVGIAKSVLYSGTHGLFQLMRLVMINVVPCRHKHLMLNLSIYFHFYGFV